MKKRLKVLGWILLAALIVIQFFQPKTNSSPAYSGHRMKDAYAVPSEVEAIFENSCFDCHSNNSKPMWYMKVQPIGWWVSDHIEEGKEELNFDEFGTYSLRRQYRKFEEIADQINENEMPLSSYTLIHDNAELSDQEKNQVVGWANSMHDWMKATYPEDSLVKKQ